MLKKMREEDASLPPEESTILATLLPGSLDTYRFDGRDSDALFNSYCKFTELVEGIADPSLISSHLGVCWLFGIVDSIVAPALFITSFSIPENAVRLVSAAYTSLWVLIGGLCFVAALRVCPATIRKLPSLLPGSRRPSQPLDLNNVIPVFLTASAFVGFAFLAFSTSNKFAVLIATLVILNFEFRYLLEAPTGGGRKVLADLTGFREFLRRADADRFNRENKPGYTPRTLEKYSGYAVALDVEHARGEEFAESMLELVQFDQAYSPRLPMIILL